MTVTAATASAPTGPTNFDIFAAAGGKFTAISRTFTVNANAGGGVVIAFTAGAADSPMINGITVN